MDSNLDFSGEGPILYLMGSKKWKKAKTTVGSIFIDLGKLSFGSLILGSILRGGLDPFQTFMFGTAVAIILFVGGILFVSVDTE